MPKRGFNGAAGETRTLGKVARRLWLKPFQLIAFLFLGCIRLLPTVALV